MSGAGLLDERLLIAQPSLVRAVGLPTAVVVQQVHYHLVYEDGTEEHDGHRWWPVTVARFADEVGLSADQMRRILAGAEEAGLLVSCQPEGWSTRRKWYRVDRAAVDAAVGESAASKRAESPVGNRAKSPVLKRADSPLPLTPEPEEPAEAPTASEAGSPRGERQRFVEFDALVEVFGEPGTKEEAGFYAKVARSLKAQGKTADEIRDRGRRARGRHATCTPNVLLTRWSQFAPPGGGATPRGRFDDLAGPPEGS